MPKRVKIYPPNGKGPGIEITEDQLTAMKRKGWKVRRKPDAKPATKED